LKVLKGVFLCLLTFKSFNIDTDLNQIASEFKTYIIKNRYYVFFICRINGLLNYTNNRKIKDYSF